MHILFIAMSTKEETAPYYLTYLIQGTHENMTFKSIYYFHHATYLNLIPKIGTFYYKFGSVHRAISVYQESTNSKEYPSQQSLNLKPQSTTSA
jgi:hypothetical protein